MDGSGAIEDQSGNNNHWKPTHQNSIEWIATGGLPIFDTNTGGTNIATFTHQDQILLVHIVC